MDGQRNTENISLCRNDTKRFVALSKEIDDSKWNNTHNRYAWKAIREDLRGDYDGDTGCGYEWGGGCGEGEGGGVGKTVFEVGVVAYCVDFKINVDTPHG